MKKSGLNSRLVELKDIVLGHRLLIICYMLFAVIMTMLIAKNGYQSDHKFYDDIVFESDGINYTSEKMSVPAGIFSTSIVYSSSEDCMVEIFADNEVIAGEIATATPDGGYNVLTLLNGTVESTSNYVISFRNSSTMQVSVLSVEFAATVQMNKDHRAKAVVCFVLLMTLLVYIIRVMEGKINKMKAIVLFTLSAFVLYVSAPLSADAVFAAHDLWGLCGRIEGIKDALVDGQIFPIVLPDSNNGYGYLGFMYPELFLLIPALLRKADVTMMTAYQIYILIVNIATALITYTAVYSVVTELNVIKPAVAGKNENRIDIISLCCSVFYLLSTYRLTDIYIRAAVGEAVAMAFLPLMVAGMFHIYTGERKKWYLLVIGASGLLHSHILTCAMVIPLLVIITIPYIKRIYFERRYRELAYAIGLFLLLNSWYIIPFIRFYLFGLNTDALIIEYIEEHTVPVRQMFAINVNAGSKDEMVLTIGMSSLIVIILTGLYFVEIISDKKNISAVAGFATEYVFMSVMTISAIGHLIVSLDIFPWKWVEGKYPLLRSIFSMLQFPYRLLTIVMVCLTFMLAVSMLRLNTIEKYGVIFTVGILLLSIVNGSSLMDRYITGEKDIKEYTGGFADHTPADYLPAGTNELMFYDYNAYIDNGNISYDKNGTNVEVSYSAAQDSLATIPLLYYPCYKAFDENGNKISLFKAEDNRIGMSLPAGEHTVNIGISLFW